MQSQTHPKPVQTLENHCPVCGSDSLQDILELRQIPVLANVLWDHKTEALSAPRGDVLLTFCADCGHAFNRAFDPALMVYDPKYENSLHFSPRFQEFADELAQRLVDRYDLRGKTIVEIGSGKGEFLRSLCDLGGCRGIGFDPSYIPEDQAQENITFIGDLYNEQYAHYHADLVVSRHVLEHIHQPASFVESLRQVVTDPHQVVYTEVPNFAYILRDTAVWDVIYEHYSYFSPRSLAVLFTQAGFEMLDWQEAFGEQFLSIEAVPAGNPISGKSASWVEQPVASLPTIPSAGQVEYFRQNVYQKISTWREQINRLQQAQKKAVLWGAGSKGISFLNMLGLRDEIAAVVDINPRKRGKFITGSGQQIVPPEVLAEIKPDTLIIMNPIYLQEIKNTVSQLGLKPDFMIA